MQAYVFKYCQEYPEDCRREKIETPLFTYIYGTFFLTAKNVSSLYIYISHT